MQIRSDIYPINIPDGYCQCGCGTKTDVSTYSHKRENRTKGKPLKYVLGHNGRSPLQVVYGVKKCQTCNQYKSIHDFKPLPKNHQRDSEFLRVAGHCETCLAKVRRSYRQTKTHTEQRYETHLRRTYGITIADLSRMIEDQGGKCPICLGDIPLDITRLGRNNSERPCVDHCHVTGKIRGILCGHCNRALGLLRDDQQRLERAIDYLKEAAIANS